MQLKKLSDTRLRILVSLHSSIFLLANSSKDIFDYIIDLMDTLSNRRITLNYNALNESELSRFYKWIQITIAKYVTGNDKALLAKLRRDISSYLPLLVGKVVVTRFDTLAIPAFLEFVYSMIFTVFILC